MVSVGEEEENGKLVKLNTNQIALNTQYSIMDAAIKSPDTSFVLQPVREVRPNKLLRSRAPLNQQKCRESSSMKILVTLPDTSSLNSLENETTVDCDNLFPLTRMDGAKSVQDNNKSSVEVTSFVPELVLSPAKLGQ